MANIKISDLPIGYPTNSSYFPFVDTNVTYKTEFSSITYNTVFKTYSALLTQTGSLTATTVDDFLGSLIIGELYEITTYNSGDDFSNVADVVSGVINQTGCIFVATGGTPLDWTNGSTLVSDGGLIVDELENSLGFNVQWDWAPLGGSGYYFMFNGDIGPTDNTFPRNRTSGTVSVKYGFNVMGTPIVPTITPISDFGIDAVMVLETYDSGLTSLVDNQLYYTPVLIKIYF